MLKRVFPVLVVLGTCCFLLMVPSVSGDNPEEGDELARLRESVRNQVVEFTPAFADPETLLGLDAQGRAIFITGPQGNRYRRLDASGRVLEVLDEQGNREIYRESEEPHTREVIYIRPGVGRWREISIHDVDEWRVLEIVNPDRGDFGALEPRLEQLGLAEGVVPPRSRIAQRERDLWTIHTNATSYARFETSWGAHTWLTAEQREASQNGEEAPESVLIWREVSTIMGQKMLVERFRERERYVVTDDWGGWRAETFGESGLTSVSDRAGRVVWITRDVHGRLCELILGDTTILRYRYEDDVSPSWSVKELVNLSDGRVLRHWERGIPVTRSPESRLRAFMPFHGLVAEWDSRHPWGVGIASLGSNPYALLPLDGNGKVMRSLTIQDPQGSYSWDRIDYNEDTITLHVALDPGGVINSAPREEVIVDLVRVPPPDDQSLEHIEGTPGTNCCSYCCSGDGGGEDGGSTEGLPLNPTQQQQVNQAINKAQNTLAASAACREMFNDLNRSNGSQVIDDTEYRAAEAGDSNCVNASAYTRVNSLTVLICQSFSNNLTTNGRAVRLIHEALHSAGMTERPQDPTAARTSAEINAWVKATCGL